MLARVRAHGGDVERLIAELRLPASAETDAEIVMSLAGERALFDAAAAAIGDPFLGVHLATDFELGTFRLVEYLVRSSSTVRDAAARLARYASLLSDAQIVTFRERDGLAAIEQRTLGDPLGAGRHGGEFFVVMIVAQGRAMTDPAFAPRRAWFAHARPPDESELVNAVGTRDLTFDAGASGIEIDGALLGFPLASRDPALAAVLDQSAEQALGSKSAVTCFADAVRAAIRRAMDGSTPALPTIARALGLSPRTLQRRLRDDRTSFQQLIDAEREQLARDYVRDARMPIGEIAYRLGFAETSPFFRAFRRWTGMTPTAFRGQSLRAPPISTT